MYNPKEMKANMRQNDIKRQYTYNSFRLTDSAAELTDKVNGTKFISKISRVINNSISK